MNNPPEVLALIEKEHLSKKNYLDFPATELLEAFGKGNHIHGSGSAAAFSGLMAIELMRTVLHLSMSKKEYEKSKEEFGILLSRLTDEASQNLFSILILMLKYSIKFHIIEDKEILRKALKNETNIDYLPMKNLETQRISL